METAQSFAARRPATSNLPTFQLPPPDLGMHKYQQSGYAPTSISQATPTVTSHVLTPPPGVPNDLSPLGSSVNSGSSGSSTGGFQQGFWPTPQSTNNFAFSSAPPMSNSFAPQQNYMNRPVYSSMNYPNRNPNSPTATEGLPAPPFESLPPFTTSMPMSGSGGQQNLPTLAPQGQQQMNNSGLLNMQQSTTQSPQQGSIHAPDNYGGRAPPTPTYYPPSSTPQQPNFPAYTQQSPTQQSPNTSSAPSNRISPISGAPHPSMGAPHGYQPRPYAYNLPTLASPIMSNVHQPGNQMTLLGGMNSLYGQHPLGGPIYGHHAQQQQQHLDRPFRCDVCPQSFNRNHDLKRHKRIHLAVKPFPCNFCEKSFSRKDALKRHILVKGCGKNSTSESNKNADSQSPVEKSEVMSDENDENPEIQLKKEMS